MTESRAAVPPAEQELSGLARFKGKSAHRFKEPIKVELAPGSTYYACTCGSSKNFPHCDGSHEKWNADNGTSFMPIPVQAGPEGQTAYFCGCGKTGNKPFCNGSHLKLSEGDIQDIEDLYFCTRLVRSEA